MKWPVEQPGRLDQFLVGATGHTRMFLKEQIEAGRVRVNGAAVRKPAAKVRAGDVVEGELVEAKPLDLVPVAGNLEILFEDEHLLALNKRQGDVVHPAAGHRGETLVHYLLHHLRESSEFRALSEDRPGIVHRLDRGTSGVIVIAKSRRVQAALSQQFKDRLVKKEYEAVAWGVLKPSGTWKSVIGRDRADRKKMSSRTEKGRSALTKWTLVRAYGHCSHVALFPHTGRTHQLRVHLTEAGHPIVGDPLYGRARAVPEPLAFLTELTETLLHARGLALTHPVTGEALVFEAKRPEIFDKTLALLGERDG